MKKMKKFASVLLALVMTLSLAAVAFAAPANPGSITIKNPEDTPADAEHTYNVYRVFDMTRAEAEGSNAVSYTASAALKAAIETDETVSSYFTFGVVANDDTKWTVTPTTAFDEAAAKAFSVWLSTRTNLLTQVNEEAIVLKGDESRNITVPYGYYFVDSTVGSLFMLDSTNPDVTITDKNLTPKSEKKWDNDNASKQIGDTVNFTITVTAQKGAESYVVHDTMSPSLTLNASSFSVTVDGAALDADNYSVVTDELADDCTFHVVFTQAYLDTITAETTIVISYSAVINANATEVRVGNSSHLDYGDNQHTPESTVGTGENNPSVFDFDLVKTTSDGTVLNGAQFQLYREDEIVHFLKEEDQYTVCAAGTEGAVTTIDAGNVRINGLGAVKYTLKETAAPQGYNALTEDVTVDMTNKADKNATVVDDVYQESDGVQVINYTGAELPSTGGIGTTIFYVVGGILIAAAGILLITKKRMGAAE